MSKRMLALVALLAASGCLAAHEPGSETARGQDGGVSSCEAQCRTCAAVWGSSVQDCLTGCELRREVAYERGCPGDFDVWSSCLAERCDVGTCQRYRTCW